MATQINSTAVKLHAPFTGANNAVVAKDYSRSNHALTFNGNAKISTAQSYYNGGSSLVCPGGNGDYVSTPHHADYNLGNASALWTIKFKIRVTGTASGDNNIITHGVQGSPYNGWLIYEQNSTNKLIFLTYNTSTQGTVISELTTAMYSYQKWHDMHIVANGTTVTWFVDGIPMAIRAQALINDATVSMYIGADTLNQNFNGYLQDVMIIKGEAWNTHKFYDTTLDAKSAYLKAGWKFGDYGVNDCVGSHTLTNVGTVTFTTVGLQGHKTATFNGSSQQLNIGSGHSDFNFNGVDFTFLCWVNPDTVSAYQGIVNSSDGSSAQQFVFYIRTDAKLHLWTRDSGSVTKINKASDSTISSGAWSLVGFTKSGDTFTIYINGSASGSVTLAYTAPSSNGLGIGSFYWNDNSTQMFDGKMQDAYIYKGTALSQDEISLLYNSGKAKLLQLERREHKQYYGDAYLDSYSKYLVANWKLDEMSGARYDSAGLNPLTDNNTVTYATDATFGRVAQLTRANAEYLSLASPPASLQPTDKMTFAVWFNMDTDVGGSDEYWLFNGKNAGANSHAFYFYIAPSNTFDGAIYQSNNAAKVNTPATVITKNAWHHAALVADGSNVRIYYDGEEIGTATAYDGTIRVSDSSISIGNRFALTDKTFDGKMCGALFYTGVALDATAISRLYNAGVGTEPSYDYVRNGIYGANHLIASWPMQETSGNRIDTRNGYSAADNGSVGYTTGKTRTNSADFSGSNYLEVDHATYDFAALMATLNFSMLFWIKFTSTAQQVIFDTFYNPGNPQGIQADVNATTAGRINFNFYNGSGTTASLYHNGSYNDGNWHRVAVTVVGATAKLYVDNVLRSTLITCAIADSGRALAIGSIISGSYQFVGQMQELSILDTAVDDAFIASDYSSGTGWFYRYST